MKDIVALIVTYNRKERLMNCIGGLLNQEGGSPDIFVVDNDSTDGTYEVLEPLIENGTIQYMNLGRNLGSAGGYEHGTRKVVDMGYRFVWFLHDDIIPKSNALLEYKKAHNALRGRYGFLAGKVVYKDGEICTLSMPKITLRNKIENFDKDLQRVSFATFASLFVCSKVIKKVFLPIGEFFVGYDGKEYTQRISDEYPCYYVKDSVSVHYSDNKHKIHLCDADKDDLKKYDYEYRNKYYIYKKEGTVGLICFAMSVTKDLADIAVKSKDAKGRRLKVMFIGTLKGTLYNPTIDRA